MAVNRQAFRALHDTEVRNRMNNRITTYRWQLMLFVLTILALIITSGHGSAAAFEPPGEAITHKVIAAPGLLDAGASGIDLWHDYGAFALYRVTDAAWQRLPAATRAAVTLADSMDQILIDGFQEAIAAAGQASPLNEAQSASEIKGMDASTPAGPALHLVQFVGPIKDEWLQTVTAAGATPIHYIANNGYLLWADAAGRAMLG